MPMPMAPRTFPRSGVILHAMVVAGGLLLAAIWVLGVLYISSNADHCRAVKGPALDDDECRTNVEYAILAAMVSLIQLSVVIFRELGADAEARDQMLAAGGAPAGADPGQQQGPQRRSLVDSDRQAVKTILAIVLFSVVIAGLGAMLRHLGSSLVLEFPGEMAPHQVKRLGYLAMRLGVLIFAVGDALLFVPYALIRIKRFVRENNVRVSAVSA